MYRNEDEFVRGQKIKLGLIVLIALVLALGMLAGVSALAIRWWFSK